MRSMSAIPIKNTPRTTTSKRTWIHFCLHRAGEQALQQRHPHGDPRPEPFSPGLRHMVGVGGVADEPHHVAEVANGAFVGGGEGQGRGQEAEGVFDPAEQAAGERERRER